MGDIGNHVTMVVTWVNAVVTKYVTKSHERLSCYFANAIADSDMGHVSIKH